MSKLKSLLSWFANKCAPFVNNVDNPIQEATRLDSVSSKSNVVKECTRDKATRERVRQAFKKQEEQVYARMAAHNAQCKDTMRCTGCYKRVQDKKASKPYALKKRMRRVRDDNKKSNDR